MINPPQRPPSSRLSGWIAIGITLTALGAVILWGRQQLREQMRSGIIGRDATILYALAQREQSNPAEDLEGFEPDEEFYQMGTLLRMAELTNILASRLFGPDGSFVLSVPAHVREGTLEGGVRARLEKGEAVARFIEAMPREELFLFLPDGKDAAAEPLACVEINVPLLDPRDGALVGVAQFLLEGVTTQRELDRLDRRLNGQSLLVLAVVSVLVVLSLTWAFRRVGRANRLLWERTADLQRANQELAEAAKVTAVGAVAAHLIHSLRNPVAGLQSFVVARQEQAGPAQGEEWREALAATRRMQTLIQQVVQVLRERETETSYTLPLEELATSVITQARTLADQKGVRLAVEGQQLTAPLDNRTVGILRLILANLVQNGVEASVPGQTVLLRFRHDGTHLIIDIVDHGRGIPESLRPRLFQPIRSTKEGGSGIGLAISRQLAAHLGADLSATSTSESGTTFTVRLPATQPLTLQAVTR